MLPKKGLTRQKASTREYRQRLGEAGSLYTQFQARDGFGVAAYESSFEQVELDLQLGIKYRNGGHALVEMILRNSIAFILS